MREVVTTALDLTGVACVVGGVLLVLGVGPARDVSSAMALPVALQALKAGGSSSSPLFVAI